MDTKGKILVVDDTLASLKLIKTILTENGYTVLTANSGELALSSVTTIVPDIILLDIRMEEGIDGFEVCRKLKENQLTKEIPVIFLSALIETGDKVQGLKLGAVDFISKPFQHAELLARVQIHLYANLMRLQLEKQAKELADSNQHLEIEIKLRKLAETKIQQRIETLTQPIGDETEIGFNDLFDIAEIQKIQDQFTAATGVASVITLPDGKPITVPSNFCRLCNNIIRKTEKGLKNCMYSDSIIGRKNGTGPTIQPCLSGHLWDAGSPIMVGDKHIANWLIGQVRDESLPEKEVAKYADEIGVDREEYLTAYREITPMNQEQFSKIADLLYLMANQLSQQAYQNLMQARHIHAKQQAEQALKEREALYRTTLYSIGDAVITTDLKGNVQQMNTISEALTGYTEAEAKGKPIVSVFNIVNETTRKTVINPVADILKTGQIVGLANHTLLISKDGTEYPIADSGAPIKDEKGELLGTVLVFRDQTEERKKNRELEESEGKFRQVFEHSPIGKSMTMIDGTLRVNHAFCNMLGYTETELKNKKWQEITHPDDIEESLQVIQKLVTSEYGVNYEKRYIHKNGSVVYTDVYSKLQRDRDNNPDFFITSIINITRRKLAEEKLRRSEEELKKAQHITHIGSWYLDVDTNEVVWTEELYRMYGFDPTLPPPPYTEHKKLFTPESWEMLSTSLAHTSETGIPYELELKTVRQDGGNGWMWVRGETVQNAEGKTLGLWGAAQDITERKMNELLMLQKNDEILAQNEEFQQLNEELDQTNIELLRAKREAEEGEIRYHMVVSNAPIVSFVIDSNGIFTLSEGKGLAKLGLKPGQVVGLSAFEVYKDFPDIVRDVQFALNGTYRRVETALPGVVFDLVYTPLFDKSGKVIEVIGVAYDITERKLAEQLLIESEMRSRSTFDQSSVGSVIVGLDKRFIKCNAAFCRFLGYAEDELIGKTISEVTFPNDIELGIPDMKLMIEGKKETSTVQKRYLHKDGTVVWGEVSISLGRDAENKPLCFLPIIQDITERKRIEVAMHKSEELYRTLFEQASDGIFISDLTGNYTDVNQSGCSMLGYTRDEILKLNITDLVSTESLSNSSLKLNQLNSGTVINSEREMICKNGTIIQVEISAKMLPDGRFQGIVRDITKRKLIEAALVESEEKFSKVFHDAPVLIAITDMYDATYIDVNDYSIKVSGFSREEIIGHTAAEIEWITAEDRVLLVQESRDKGIISGLEMNFKTKDGRVLTGWVNGEQIIIGGKPCLLTVTVDITEHKKLSEEVRKERKLLRTLIDNIPDAIYVKDEFGRKLVTNPADLRLLNSLDESDILGKTDLELLPASIGERGYNDDMEVINSGQTIINKEEFFVLSDGKPCWLLTSKLPISNNTGKIIGLVGIGRDVTEQKKGEEMIVKLSTAMEQSPLTILITNIKGEIEYTNPKFTQITGYTTAEAKGLNPRVLKSGETSSEEYANLWKTISSGKEWHGEFHNKKRNGELYWESASISPIRNDKGEIINYIAIKEDITNQKLLINELVISKEKAEESDRLKSAFLANMSHEIRTPLNGILGFSELLADPDFDQAQKTEMSRLILDNGDQLLAIINDVLDISKIESGQIEIRRTKFSANEMIIDIRKSFLSRAAISGVELKIDQSISQKDIQLNSDYTRVKQVLTNLVSNALKFTDIGFIEIGYFVMDKELLFHVKDTGIGIPMEFQKKIFERFRHLEPNRSKIIGGNGLGLAISKSFIEMLGGRIWVESEVGKGSCFYFSIPL